MALPYNAIIDYDDVLGVDCDQSPADVGVFIVPMKCKVITFGVVVTEVCAGSSATPQVSFDLRPTAASDTNRAEKALLKLLTTAAGKVMYSKPATPLILEPGNEIVFEVKAQAVGTASGHVRPFVLVEPMDEVVGNLANMILTT